MALEQTGKDNCGRNPIEQVAVLGLGTIVHPDEISQLLGRRGVQEISSYFQKLSPISLEFELGQVAAD